MQRYSSYRVLVFPNFAAIAHPKYCVKCVLSEEEPLENIVRRFQSGGLVSAMTTPPKGVKLGTSHVRQLPRMRSHTQIVEDPGPEQEEEVHMAANYIVPRLEDAPEVTIPKGAKFLVPLPAIDPCVKKDGDLLGYVPVLKFIDYNLGDSKTYPQFQPDQYLTIQRNPRTNEDDFVPMEHVQIIE